MQIVYETQKNALFEHFYRRLFYNESGNFQLPNLTELEHWQIQYRKKNVDLLYAWDL